MRFIDFIKISRPRFWLYELGTFFIGVLMAIETVTDLLEPKVLLFGLFFLIPANLFIYGINDIFDYETDRLNPKKVAYESLLTPDKHKKVWRFIILFNLPFFIFSFFLSIQAFISLFLFFFFALFYSAPPIRAKARPFLDSFFSAAHYLVTGIFGFYLVTNSTPNFFVVFGVLLWAMAMHVFSAVPDIEADREAKLETTATFLGNKKSILWCTFLYFGAGLFLFPSLGLFAVLATLVYIFLMFFSLRAKNYQSIFKIYTYFPLINALLPMIWSIYFMVINFS